MCLKSMLKVQETIACMMPMPTMAPATILMPSEQETKALGENKTEVDKN